MKRVYSFVNKWISSLAVLSFLDRSDHGSKLWYTESKTKKRSTIYCNRAKPHFPLDPFCKRFSLAFEIEHLKSNASL